MKTLLRGYLIADGLYKRLPAHHNIADIGLRRRNYSKLYLTRGSLAAPDSVEMVSNSVASLKLTWPVFIPLNAGSNDTLMVFIACPSIGAIWCHLEANFLRNTGRALLRLPRTLSGRELHVWLSFRAPNRRSYSDSRYIGKITTPNATAYEKEKKSIGK